MTSDASPDISDTNLVWMDLEMTGLDVERDRILEIAVIVTDQKLRILAEGPVIAVHQSEEVLAGMDDWNREHHTSSGLVERVRSSTVGEKEAERIVLETDCPYMAPVPHRGKRNEPAFVALVMQRLADAYAVTPEQVERQTNDNVKRVFGI